MTAVSLPTRKPLVVFGTNKGRALFQDDAQRTDHNGVSSTVPTTWRAKGWLGTGDSRTRKSQVSLRLAPECNYTASVASSLWSRKTTVFPAATATPDAAATLYCSSTAYGGFSAGIAANPYGVFSIHETASSVFTVHEIGVYAQSGADFPGADGGKRLG